MPKPSKHEVPSDFLRFNHLKRTILADSHEGERFQRVQQVHQVNKLTTGLSCEKNIRVLQDFRKTTEDKTLAEAIVGVGRPSEASRDITDPFPRRPRRDPTRPSSPAGTGAAKRQQERGREQQLHLKNRSHNKAELLSSTRLNR